MPMMIHLSEYLIEGVLLGGFMFAACAGVVVLEHPGSPIRRAILSTAVRRAIMGVFMGLTAVALITSPWGVRTGAHMNPAVTLTFWALGKVHGLDAIGYGLGQFLGAIAGVWMARLVLGGRVSHPSVRFAVTQPGRSGAVAAFGGECLIALGMMSMVLYSTNHAWSTAYTPIFAGVLVAVFIAVEAPISGMSMNPARTLASAVHAKTARGLWVYFTAPPAGMLLAAAVHLGVFGQGSAHCAKLRHPDSGPCLFRCSHDELRLSK